MRRRWWSGAVTLAAVLATSPATAGQCAADLQARAATSNASALIADLIACVAEQQAEIAALQTEAHDRIHNHDSGYSRLSHTHDYAAPGHTHSEFVPALGDHPETRAIVAYFSGKGQKTCPDGWSPYEEAKDRFILGASFNYPEVGQTGGEEMVALTLKEMPAHRHDVSAELLNVRQPGSDPNIRLAQEAFRDGQFFLGSSGETGGSQPHNNMPPYIALYFCKKD